MDQNSSASPVASSVPPVLTEEQKRIDFTVRAFINQRDKALNDLAIASAEVAMLREALTEAHSRLAVLEAQRQDKQEPNLVNNG